MSCDRSLVEAEKDENWWKILSLLHVPDRLSYVVATSSSIPPGRLN